MTKGELLNWLHSIKERPLNYGPVRTWKVAKSLGIDIGLARRLLVQLERDGKLARSERYSRPNALAWEFPYDAARSDVAAQAQAKEGAERAAYLERWKDAPEDATHLAQDSDGVCAFYGGEPALDSDQNWFGSIVGHVENNLLGSVKCEPRPVQG